METKTGQFAPFVFGVPKGAKFLSRLKQRVVPPVSPWRPSLHGNEHVASDYRDTRTL